MGEQGFATFQSDSDWVNLGSALFCVLCAALAAGLTMGLLSLDPLQLEIKSRSGTAAEQEEAGKVLPITRRHHLLLVTLLLFNSLANEALPLFLDKLVPTYAAVILSVTMVLFMGEIIPSALFTGPNQLHIAARLTGFVWCIIVLFFPLSYPIAWVLDRVLGTEKVSMFNRTELSTLFDLYKPPDPPTAHRRTTTDSGDGKHSRGPGGGRGGGSGSGDGAGGALANLNGGSVNNSNIRPTPTTGSVSWTPRSAPENDVEWDDYGEGDDEFPFERTALTVAEVKVVQGVLAGAQKTISEIMIPMDDVYCLSDSACLDANTMADMLSTGFSRVPVYHGDVKSNLCGFLILKRLIVVSPEDERGVNQIPLRQFLCVAPTTNILDTLSLFQEGKSHIAVVSHSPLDTAERMKNKQPLDGDAAPLGIVTLEDVLEDMIQQPILDEQDRQVEGRAISILRHIFVRQRQKREEASKMRRVPSMLRKLSTTNYFVDEDVDIGAAGRAVGVVVGGAGIGAGTGTGAGNAGDDTVPSTLPERVLPPPASSTRWRDKAERETIDPTEVVKRVHRRDSLLLHAAAGIDPSPMKPRRNPSAESLPLMGNDAGAASAAEQSKRVSASGRSSRLRTKKSYHAIGSTPSLAYDLLNQKDSLDHPNQGGRGGRKVSLAQSAVAAAARQDNGSRGADTGADNDIESNRGTGS